jgi:hypothetical protein
MTPKADVASLVQELRATLDQIGDALVNGSFDDLIATESRLAGIVSGFNIALARTAAPVPVMVPPASELEDAMCALRRCQKLGASFSELGTAWMAVGHPRAGGYDRSGRASAQASSTTIYTRA